MDKYLISDVHVVLTSTPLGITVCFISLYWIYTCFSELLVVGKKLRNDLKEKKQTGFKLNFG